jgi:hypothetical protein
MKHIRSHNLKTYDIFCDVVLRPVDIELIRACVGLVDDTQERVHITLTDNRPASITLMPDTAIPIVRALCPSL